MITNEQRRCRRWLRLISVGVHAPHYCSCKSVRRLKRRRLSRFSIQLDSHQSIALKMRAPRSLVALRKVRYVIAVVASAQIFKRSVTSVKMESALFAFGACGIYFLWTLILKPIRFSSYLVGPSCILSWITNSSVFMKIVSMAPRGYLIGVPGDYCENSWRVHEVMYRTGRETKKSWSPGIVSTWESWCWHANQLKAYYSSVKKATLDLITYRSK